MIASLLLAAACAAPLHAQESAPVLLRWNPAQGSKLTRRIELSHDLALAKMSMFRGGAEQLAQQRLTVKSRLQVLLRDDLQVVDERGCGLLKRKFDDWMLDATLATGSAGAEETTAFEAVSPLSGSSVVHQRLAGGGYGRHYDEREASEEFLARLWEDAELRGFLPSAPVAEGAEWTVQPSALVEAFCPGGAVPLRFTKGDDNLFVRQLGAGIGGPLHELLPGAAWDGSVKARLVRVETVEGARQAVVALQLDVRAVADQTAFYNDSLGKFDLVDGRKVVKSETTFVLQGGGELRFGLDEGFVRALALEGKERVSSSVLAERGGKEDLRQSIELAGTLKLSWTCTPAKQRKAPAVPPK